MSNRKRVLDVLVAAGGLVVLFPIFGVIGLSLLVTQGRPVLFKQMRPGLHGRLFTMYKFRTMAPVAPAGRDDASGQRLTRFGTFLRSTSLDELPELWNVLRGDMSLVGPRPLLPHYLPLYSERQARRHEVRPGITGWAQVNGRNLLSWPERFEHDVWYVENWSFSLDLEILRRTVAAVLTRRGIGLGAGAEVPPFAGNSDTRTERPSGSVSTP